MKHHFLPVFLLKQWAGQDGKVAVFRRLEGGERARHLHPRGVGYGVDLLAFTRDISGPLHRQYLERQVFMDVDSRAAPVRTKLATSGAANLTPEERHAWARLLISIQLRQPQIVSKARAVGEPALLNELARVTPEERAVLEKFGLQGGLAEWLEERVPGLAENFGLALYPDLLDDPETLTAILGLSWWVADLDVAPRDLLLSDAPTMFNRDITEPRFIWVLPIEPRRAFFAFAAAFDEAKMRRWSPARLTRTLNRTSLFQARERVFAHKAAQGAEVRRVWADIARAARKNVPRA